MSVLVRDVFELHDGLWVFVSVSVSFSIHNPSESIEMRSKAPRTAAQALRRFRHCEHLSRDRVPIPRLNRVQVRAASWLENDTAHG